MSSRITIGTDDRSLCDIDESWIAQQILRRRQNGAPVCIVVKIESNGQSMTLASAGCARGGGNGSWIPSPQQQQIINLWNRHNLGANDIKPGELIAFLKQVCK